MFVLFLGVRKVMVNPPLEFLGAKVECQVVNDSETDIFSGSCPQVLKIRNLPLELLSKEALQQSLEMMFQHAGGHEVREMKVVDGDVYIHFSNPKGQYTICACEDTVVCFFSLWKCFRTGLVRKFVTRILFRHKKFSPLKFYSLNI